MVFVVQLLAGSKHFYVCVKRRKRKMKESDKEMLETEIEDTKKEKGDL